MTNNCWKCSSFRTDSTKHYDTGRFFYYCKRGAASFPKTCGHYDYEPGSDHAVRQQEKKT